MEKKLEITGPVGNADIQKRIKQLALAYALSPPENRTFELAQWRTIAEFATEALRLSRVSNETGVWGAGLFAPFDLGGTKTPHPPDLKKYLKVILDAGRPLGSKANKSKAIAWKSAVMTDVKARLESQPKLQNKPLAKQVASEIKKLDSYKNRHIADSTLEKEINRAAAIVRREKRQ